MCRCLLLVAIGVNDEGFREVLAVAEGSKEDKASWTEFLRHLKERGLQGVRLFVSDKCFQVATRFKATFWRQCPLHFVGVWDTVSSVGWIWDPVKLPYTPQNPDMMHIVAEITASFMNQTCLRL